MTHRVTVSKVAPVVSAIALGALAPVPARAATLQTGAPAVVYLASLVRHRVADSVDGVAQLRHRRARPGAARSSTMEALLGALGDGELLEASMELPLERLKALQPDALLRLYDGEGALLAESPLSRVVPDFDGRTATVRVESLIDNSARRLRPGQAVRARVILHFDKALTVPVQAVLRIGGRSFVMVAEGHRGRLVARRRAVTLGGLVDGGYVVRGGVAAGERVVACSPRQLDDGAALQAP
jgi:hypothetical protein